MMAGPGVPGAAEAQSGNAGQGVGPGKETGAHAQRRSTARSSAVQRKEIARAKQPRAAPEAVPLRTEDLPKRSSVELEELIVQQRKLVAANPKDETVRRNLGWISVEVANRVLEAESLGRIQEVSVYTTLIRTGLADTLWRVTQIAQQGTARARAALGLYHSEGILVPKDYARGCNYFSQAAAAGHVAAAYRASLCLANTDPERARQWLGQSARGGHAGAQEAMGRTCIENTSIDAACAKRWLEPAAGQGRVGAMSLLAWLHAREGTEAALLQAAKLYRTAAEAGDLAAQNNLGEFYETGRGVPRQPVQALDWYRRSAEKGFAPAQFNLARLLAYGVGTERDPASARGWATKAQEQGIGQAAELLKLLAEAEKPR
jgi:hypothetical protein